jgi:NDP-sugar pyrophosphorylase family protein
VKVVLFPYAVASFFELSNFPHKNLWDECEFVWEALHKLETYLKHAQGTKIDPKKYPGVFFENHETIFAHESVVIEPGSFVRGPCILEEGVQIRHGAYVRGFVILGKGAVVGHCSEVVRSVFFNEAKAPHFNYVGDSILGNRVNLGAGFITANLKHTKKEVFVPGPVKKVSTGLSKFGAIIGDDSMLGCNGVSNPGTFFPKKSATPACSSFKGVIS